MDAVDLLRNRAGKVQALAAKVIRRHILHHAGLRLPDVELVAEAPGNSPSREVFRN